MSWGYGKTNGPSFWHYKYPLANGKSQSPINIETSRAVYDPLIPNMLAFRYNYERELQIVNTGHSLEGRINQLSEISGSPLRHTYRLEQFHFHWGSTSRKGSEHTINGKQYAGEVHLVHYNSDKYKNFVTAVNKHDGLCVVAVIIEAGDEHYGFQMLLDHVDKVKSPGSKFTINSFFSPACLLPGNTYNYWSYHGSLTTPPLNESVEWIVLNNTIELSQEQLACLRTMKDSDGGSMQDNFRPPCHMKNRKLYKSFV